MGLGNKQPCPHAYGILHYNIIFVHFCCFYLCVCVCVLAVIESNIVPFFFCSLWLNCQRDLKISFPEHTNEAWNFVCIHRQSKRKRFDITRTQKNKQISRIDSEENRKRERDSAVHRGPECLGMHILPRMPYATHITQSVRYIQQFIPNHAHLANKLIYFLFFLLIFFLEIRRKFMWLFVSGYSVAYMYLHRILRIDPRECNCLKILCSDYAIATMVVLNVSVSRRPINIC